MIIGRRLKELREHKNFSQGDIEKRTGLLRCYISRVENEHTVPSLDTLEKLASALEIPLHRVFYDGAAPAKPLITPSNEPKWGETGKDAAYWRELRGLLKRMKPHRRTLLMHLCKRLESRGGHD